MNELSGDKRTRPLSDAEVIRLGFCPDCHGPDSSVRRTLAIEVDVVRPIRGRPKKVRVKKIIRYRQCSDCGRNFRTTEETG